VDEQDLIDLRVGANAQHQLSINAQGVLPSSCLQATVEIELLIRELFDGANVQAAQRLTLL
jgi:hypothetical protein